MLRNLYWLLALVAIWPVSALRAQERVAAEDDVLPNVERIVTRLEETTGDEFWQGVARLERHGMRIRPALVALLPKTGERGRLACARILLAFDDENVAAAGEVEADRAYEAAIEALEGLTARAREREVRVAASELLGSYGEKEEVQTTLETAFDKAVSEGDTTAAIPLARSLWRLARVERARKQLVEYLGSSDPAVKQEAALALASIDYFEGDVRDVLRQLRWQPGARGRLAGELYRVMLLSRKFDADLERGAAVTEGVDPLKLLETKNHRIVELEERIEELERLPAGERTPARRGAEAVLEEIVRIVEENYVDAAKTDRTQLMLNAIKGMVRSLDEFSFFMDMDSTEEFEESMSGEYPGIGASINKRPNLPLEIAKPIYGGPAHEQGLHSGDAVLEIDGEETTSRSIDEIVKLLKGPVGTTVRLKILRRGWEEPRDFEIRRRTVEVPSVYSQTLPGEIGYAQLLKFGSKSVEEFTAAVDRLEAEGMKGFILDLRNNPGGYKEAAVQLVDQFVDDKLGLPIVLTKGRGTGEDDTSEEATYPTSTSRPGYKMVVLVNERSASASEIVAGALQDFGRAVVVGKQTFGKGSVQNLYPLSKNAKDVFGDARLRLTVRYWFLPLGRCVQTIRDEHGKVKEQGGVSPDVEVDPLSFTAWRIEEMERFRNSGAVRDYVHEHFDEIRDSFVSGDGHSSNGYPEFDALYKSLGTPSPPDDLRQVIRYHVRRRLEDERGEEFACDYHEDRQLQRALLVLLERMGKSAASIEEYARLATLSWDDKPEKDGNSDPEE